MRLKLKQRVKLDFAALIEFIPREILRVVEAERRASFAYLLIAC